MTMFPDHDSQRCPACGSANHCAIALGAEQCWCMTEPTGVVLPASNTARCYCRDCLRGLLLAENSSQLQKSPISR